MGQVCLLSAPVQAAVATCQPSAAAAIASTFSGDPRASLRAPTGTLLKFSDVSNSQAMPFPQRPCGALLGVSKFRSPEGFPLTPAPGMGLLPAVVILIISVFPNPSFHSPIRKYLALCFLSPGS